MNTTGLWTLVYIHTIHINAEKVFLCSCAHLHVVFLIGSAVRSNCIPPKVLYATILCSNG